MPANFTGSLAISGSLLLTGSITTTGGITISGSIDSASFAATASSADNFVVRQNLTGSNILASGNITAQTLVVQTVTSSITYSSGSNIFGNLPSNVQQFTGSLRVTGSGNHFIVGGNTGIGTTSPTRILDISGSAGVLRIQNGGSVGAPSLELGVQNQGSGLFAPAANTVAITTNDTERMRITSAGNVGIGTSSPNTSLQVNMCSGTAYSSGATGNAITIYNTCTINNQYVGLILQGEPAAGNAGQATIYGITTGGGAMDMAFSTRGSSVLSERMRITSGGNIVINNTSSSDAKLDVYNDASNYTAYFRSNTIYAGSYRLMRWYTNGNNIMDISSANGTDLNMFNNQNGYIIFGTNTAERMRITSGGNVGINTSGPTATSTPHFFIGTNMSMFNGASDDSYIGSNFYYNSAWYYRTANAASQIQQNGGEFYFKSSTAVGTANGALTWCERMRLTCDGILAIKTTSTSTEANLFLGAQGTVEGGQLVLQKGTSCNCATHLDNYQNSFRIMSGTDTASSTVNMSINHINGAATFNGTISGKDLLRLTPTSTVSVSTSATTISTTNNDYGALAIVWGVDGSGNIFTDLLFYSLSAVVVMQSQSPSGSPAARTYSMSSGNLRLAMGSGTYTVRYQAIFAQ